MLALDRGHPERGLSSKLPLTLCPWHHWRDRASSSHSLLGGAAPNPQPDPHASPALNPRAGKPSWTGGSWTVLMDHLLLSTTGGHYLIASCAQPAAHTRREGEGKGIILLASGLG